MEKTKIALPGQIITTQEEYLAGENTFEENGLIKSKIIGKIIFDDGKKEVSVVGKRTEMLKKGDIVFAKVILVKDSLVIVEIIDTEEERAIGLSSGQIPIRFVSNEFIKNLKDYFKIGDLIKARVVSADEISIELSTNENGLGVIMAYCSKCRKKLVYNNGKLVCMDPECGSIEKRKWFDSMNLDEKEKNQTQSFKNTKIIHNSKKHENKKFSINNGKSFNSHARENSRQRGGFRR